MSDMSMASLTLLGKSLRVLISSITNTDAKNITEYAFSKLVNFTEIIVYFCLFLSEQ